MRRITILLLTFALTGLLAPAASAQKSGPDLSDEVRAALERLPIAPGVWEGEAWHRGGPGPADTIRQVERVETRLDGTVLLIEGVGTDDGEQVFHAFGTIGYDPWVDAYLMTAWLDDGSVTEADVSYADGVFTWGFEVPDGPSIRYRISSPSDGVWEERGEIAMDGATWHPFFGMTLRRTGDVGTDR